MKAIYAVAIFLLMTVAAAVAAPPNYTTQEFPGTLLNAKYVYVAAYDGDQFDPGLLPEDRQAINSVQDAIQKWGHYVVVYRPQDADIILMVESRPSEDILAVYDANLWPQQNYLWRAMGRDGLQKGETPLVTSLQKAVEKAEATKK
jgi:hypothetical protein